MLRDGTEAEILEHAFTLPGRRLGEVVPWIGSRGTTAASRRGDVGAHIERAFGLVPNSGSGPDFPRAGIELKTVPMVLRGGLWRPKERTTIGMIDYVALANETWATASVRKKLARVLFILYRWVPGTQLRDLVIDDVFLWVPEAREIAYLRSDWSAIRAKVREGRAHLLSDSDTLVLAATTKSRDSSVRRPQVAPGPPAKPRAFTLKRAFMTALCAQHLPLRPPVESLITNLQVTRVEAFEARVTQRLRQYAGRRIGDLGDALQVSGQDSKNYSARVLRRALGARASSSVLREFEEFGIDLRIVPLAPGSDRPLEATSFPAFRYAELIDEQWETADLRERVGRILFVPVYGQRRSPQRSRILGSSFFWSPSADQWRTIEREWKMYRDAVARGEADDLPTAASTKIIHVRPHARNAADTDRAPVVGPVVKKSFWLNQSFVEELVRTRGAAAPRGAS